MIQLEPPHITGTNTHEQLQQVIRYLHRLTEQLNMEINAELDSLQSRKEE